MSTPTTEPVTADGIIYGHDEQGGFAALEPASLTSGYACPTSRTAEDARRDPGAIARAMIEKDRGALDVFPINVRAERYARVANAIGAPAHPER